MRVVVWNGCTVISSTEYEGEGPDIHLDPVNLPESLSIARNEGMGEVRESVDLSRVARPRSREFGEQVPRSTQVPK